MAGPSPRRARVGGSSYTAFFWQNQPLIFARQIAHVSPAPVGPGAVPIQALDDKRPQEIITPAAISMGQITLELYETYNARVWDKLFNKDGKVLISHTPAGKLVDLQEIFTAIADNAKNAITLEKKITPPKGANVGAGGAGAYSEVYHGIVITNVADGETIEIGTMEVLKQITVAYTHVTRSDVSRNTEK